MVPDTHPPRSPWSHRWWGMVPTPIHIPTPIHQFLDRSICHGRYHDRRSMPIHSGKIRSMSTFHADPPTENYGRSSIVDKISRLNFVIDSIDDTCVRLFFFLLKAATQLARQVQQGRTQMVCSNKVGRSRLARRYSRNGPRTYECWFDYTFAYCFEVDKRIRKYTSKRR